MNTLTQVFEILHTLASVQVQITGHTSMEGTEAYNEGLSQRRAEAVRDYLVMQGIEATRLHLLWLGENAPAVAEPREPRSRWLRPPQDEAIRDLNRRAVLTFFDPSGRLDFLPRSAPLVLQTPDLSLGLPRPAIGTGPLLQMPSGTLAESGE